MEPVPAPDDRLDAALAARLRALPQPDPGPAYFAALPDRVAARVRQNVGRPTAPDRVARPHARTRRAAWVVGVTAVLIVLVWSLPRAQRQIPRQDGRVAQQREQAPVTKPTGPAATPQTDTTRPKVVPAPIRKEGGSRRSSNPAPAPRRREPTTARPRGAPLLANAEIPEIPDNLPVPSALVTTLERARVVLLTLAHADSTDDLGVLQPLAESLVAEIATQRSAFDAADPALRSIADRLEPLLLTLAHPDGSPGTMATLRARIREDEMLFRLNVALLAAAPAVPVD